MIFLCFAAFCWLAVAGWGFFNGRQGSSVDPIYNNVINATEPNASYRYVYEGDADVFNGTVHGAVIPAPSADSEMTARMMHSLAGAASSKLVLVVTFADDLKYDVLTSWLDWQTPYGIVQVNGAAISHLLEQGAVADSAEMKKVEDMADILPYFSYYFPDKRIAPLVFDSSFGMDEVTDYMERISEYHDGCFVLMLTSDQQKEVPLFTADPESLAKAFRAAPTDLMAGTLRPEDCAKLSAVHAVLRYDGNSVLGVVQNDTSALVSFDHVAVVYGKEN